MAKATNNDFCLTLSDLANFINQDLDECAQKVKKLKLPIQMIHRKASLNPKDVRFFLETRGHHYIKKTISFQMLKGGVAKTTSALNFAIRANMYGAKVLVIDLDQQGNLSYALGVENPDLPVWVDMLEKNLEIEKIILPISETFHLVPSNLNNSVLDRVLLSGTKNIGTAVKQRIHGIKKKYDIIIIDTAPNLSAINTAVSCASDMIILPVNPDRFSFSGLSKTLEELNEIKREFGVKFQERILFTKYDVREAMSREGLEQCHLLYEKEMLNTFIRANVDAKSHILSHKTLFDYPSNCKEDYDLLTRELLEFSE